MNRPNTVLYAVIGVAGAVALAAIVTAAELHGRHRIRKEAAAIGMPPDFAAFVAADLKSAAATLEPRTDGIARIRARTQRNAA